MASEVPRQRLKEKLREVRTELILNLAEEVLEEKGYHETTMDEIAVRAGVAKGTLYQHFPSKDELIVALFERHLDRFEQAVAQAATAATTARGKLERILQYVYLERSGLHAQLLQIISYGGEMREALKGRLRERLERLTVDITKLLEEGKARSEFRAALSTELMLQTFMHILFFNKYELLLQKGHISTEDLVAQVAQIFFDGIASKQQRERF
jgi:TetR/AcrR family fatty acid metabolism transcriptional regulator